MMLSSNPILNLASTGGAAVTQQLTTFDRKTRNKVLQLPRGTRVTLGEVEGRGFIAQFWMTFPGWFWQHWDPKAAVSQTILKTLIVRIYWDGESKPAVAAPIGDLVGLGLCEVKSYASQYFGMSSGGFYCSFPMPFRKGFRIELENADEHIDTFVFANVMYQLVGDLPADAAYFHAHFRTGENPGAAATLIADVTGAGRYVGCTLSMQAQECGHLSFLEAPEQVYIDEDWDEPRIVGTGLEDYFLAGWYFREGPFIGPRHGLVVKDPLQTSVAMYRIHETDAIHFGRRLRFAFLNPWDPAKLKTFRYSSVAFLYLEQAAGCAPDIPPRQQLLCWYRMRNSDHQSMP